MRVPRLVGLMAVDARASARALGLSVDAPDRPDFPSAVVDHVVRQYPQPGTEVPRHSVVHVWFDLGPGEGGGGVRERRGPVPPPGGPRRELREPGPPPAVVLSSP
ncbi:PASTA domain-containing protein [Streptomyces pilosus]|uniref:PASTA domain-containing protein n=1 Tax=Streptomyces pilosus TaxID=28893 RepID=UPI0016741A58|nr:PASTA domain-containing protein [Streptomyces pilosus]